MVILSLLYFPLCVSFVVLAAFTVCVTVLVSAIARELGRDVDAPLLAFALVVLAMAGTALAVWYLAPPRPTPPAAISTVEAI